ncbi:MAG: hypothetical protein JO347_12895, partial [Candidatus Eremiobacteraeota bacterium]|nr:hypothetical protein [Candidatus Eremiobacteraeota bacterium]
MRIILPDLPSLGVAVALAAVFFIPTTVAGDATSAQGCLDQWLFNGVWRVQVTKVEPYMNNGQQVGWQVTEVWRNGTTQEMSPAHSWLQPQKLELANGNAMLATDSTAGSASMNDLGGHSFPVSGEYRYVQRFAGNGVDPQNKPVALDVTFDNSQLSQSRFWPHFSTPHYDFRFKLDCVASGAAAQAQGGSTQVAAVQGCMNQSISNGLWRVKVTAIGPDMGNDNAAQIGWMITEEWTNLFTRPLAPGDANVTDQQLVFASGNSAASSDSVGTSASFAQLSLKTLSPNAPFSYQQRFRPGAFDATDKPVRLLLTFNATAQNQRIGAPHYKSPANFRIDLTCSK